jgi:hypothetical protein
MNIWHSIRSALLRLFRIEECPKNAWGHDWRHKTYWNSWKRSRFTGDYIGRAGKRCYHCGEMRWDQTDAEFAHIIRDTVELVPAKVG